jgi:hypothetical protein
MQTAQAKEYFDLGIITEMTVIRDPIVPGNWLVAIGGKEGRNWTLQTKLGKDKSFSSLETVVRTIESITGRFSYFKVGI